MVAGPNKVTVTLQCAGCTRDITGYSGAPTGAGYAMTSLLARARKLGWTRRKKQGWFCELCDDQALPANVVNLKRN